MESVYLMGGLAAVFAGLAVALTSATAVGRQRSQVAHSLATIQGIGAVPGRSAMSSGCGSSSTLLLAARWRGR